MQNDVHTNTANISILEKLTGALYVYARPPYRPWVRPRAQLSLPGRCFVTGHFKHRSQSTCNCAPHSKFEI